MTIFRLDPKALNKWMHQNEAEYTGDYFYGTLLDNFTVITKRGFAAIYEHYVNCWTSDYLVKFAADFPEIDKLNAEFIEAGWEAEGIA